MFTNKFIFAADTPAGTGTGTIKKKRRRTLPASDIDFMDVAKAVAASWMNNPAIILFWKTNNAFNLEVTAYANSLGNRLQSGSVRPAQSQTLKQLDAAINAAVKEVKVYIEKKYQKANAQAQFARFGIIRENASFIFSRDRNNRKAAFDLMIAAIAADGFGNEEFGSAFWTGLQADYAAALAAASNTSGDVSEKVASKNEQKQALKKVMTALRFILRGQYPDTYPEVYRSWGWQKESY